jgi:pimeloyl-ACP methyl ester carboxylesterase
MGLLNLFYARTPRIKNEDGNIKTNSVASLDYVEIGRITQYLMIRGHNINNPILLFLHGGPGNVGGPFAYKFERELEKHFIVVNWDQRGAGKSFSKKIPRASMTIEQFILDTLEVIEYLITKFDKNKVFIVGHSWGSILGIRIASSSPELIHAYVSVGQVVNILENEKLSYEFTIEYARKMGNEKALKQLKKLNPYPEKAINNIKIIKKQRKWLTKFGGVIYNETGWWSYIKIALGSPEYSLKDLIKYIRGVRFSRKTMWPQLFEIDLPKQVPELKVPVYFCMGRHDYNTHFELAKKYFDQLKAPKKEFVWFENSAHMLNFEEYENFNDFLINKVLIETQL